MEKFIYEKHNSLSNSICNDLIEFLEIKEDKTVNTIKIADEKINNYLNIELNKNVYNYKLNNLYFKKNICKFIDIQKNIMTNNENLNKKIPKNIIQTFFTNNVHPKIHKNVMKFLKINSDYNYIFLTDIDGENLIRNNFDENTLNAFNKLKVGFAKAKFIKYAALYVYGGFYLDLDCSINIKLEDFVDKDAEFIIFYNIFNNPTIIDIPIFCSVNNKLIKIIIDEIVKRINLHETDKNIAIGPTLLNDIFYNLVNNSQIYDSHNNLTIFQKINFLRVFENNSKFFNGLVLNVSNINWFFINKKLENFIYFYEDKVDNKYNIYRNPRYKINFNNFIITKYNYSQTSINNEIKISNNRDKNLCFVWFLNNYDGEYIFWNSYKIKPEIGKFLLFPNSWCFLYEEFIKLNQDKYIIYGYVNLS